MGMTNNEKALELVQKCLDDWPYAAIRVFDIMTRLEQVKTLLKEQEPKPMIEIEDDDLYAWSPEDVSYYCPRPECGKEISYDYNFCPYCGQAVKLDD